MREPLVCSGLYFDLLDSSSVQCEGDTDLLLFKVVKIDKETKLNKVENLKKNLDSVCFWDLRLVPMGHRVNDKPLVPTVSKEVTVVVLDVGMTVCHNGLSIE